MISFNRIERTELRCEEAIKRIIQTRFIVYYSKVRLSLYLLRRQVNKSSINENESEFYRKPK